MSAIALLIQTLTGLIGLTNSLAATLLVKKQNAEMTPEEEAAFDNLAATEMQQPWWKKSTD